MGPQSLIEGKFSLPSLLEILELRLDLGKRRESGSMD